VERSGDTTLGSFVGVVRGVGAGSCVSSCVTTLGRYVGVVRGHHPWRLVMTLKRERMLMRMQGWWTGVSSAVTFSGMVGLRRERRRRERRWRSVLLFWRERRCLLRRLFVTAGCSD